MYHRSYSTIHTFHDNFSVKLNRLQRNLKSLSDSYKCHIINLPNKVKSEKYYYFPLVTDNRFKLNRALFQSFQQQEVFAMLVSCLVQGKRK